MTRSTLLRLAGRGLLWGGLLAVALETYRVVIGENQHVLIPGRVVRCAQPSPKSLARAVRQHGIRTVVNLRGTCPGFDWYDAECRATRDLDLNQEDITLSAGRLPPPNELRALLEVLDRAEAPILLHCKRGVDRTGLASALVKLLYTEAPFDAGVGELSLRYAHFRVSKTGAMDEFFTLYANWLSAQHKAHCPDLLRQFIRHDYSPGPATGSLVLGTMPETIEPDRPFAVTVWATNRSPYPWKFKAGSGVGLHVRYRIAATAGPDLQVDRAGLFVRTVEPGGAINLTLAVAGLPAGRYCLHADLMDGPDVSFTQMGGDPLVVPFTVAFFRPSRERQRPDLSFGSSEPRA